MRIFGVIFVGITIAFLGVYITSRIIERTEQLKKIIRLISFIKQKIYYKKLTVKEIFELIFKDDDFSFIKTETIENHKICFENKSLLLKEFEKKTLFEFFEGLGKSDLSGQLNHCNLYASIFEDLVLKCEEESKSKIKLFPTLFLMLSLLVIILLL